MDYDKLLDDWFDKVMEESEKRQRIADKQYDYNYKKGYYGGFAQGLIFATSILSRMERREKRKLENSMSQFEDFINRVSEFDNEMTNKPSIRNYIKEK